MQHIETERKFLVRDGRFKALAVKACRIRQGYIAHEGGNTVRVRIRDGEGFLTIKGPSLDGGLSRFEWEKQIPLADAEALFLLCHGGAIDKTRYLVPEGMNPAGRFFEVDEFYGDNEGLVMAEIELDAPDEAFQKPDWLGEEVTGDRRYYNSHLLKNPFKDWRNR